MITSVVFDLDDTLCDYTDAKRRALEEVCVEIREFAVDSDAFLRGYRLMEPKLFALFTRGSLTRDEYRRRRFADPLSELTSVADGIVSRLNDKYMSVANEAVRLFDDAAPAIRALQARGYLCAVLTNGPSDGQRNKMRHCGLSDLIPRAFVSEEIGSAKPMPAAFLAVARALSQSPSQMLMVGDSIEDDVRAAEEVGMLGVLIDRQQRHGTFGGHRVRDLHALLPIVQGPVP